MTTAIEALRQHLGTVRDLQHTIGLLSWDQRTHMPRGGNHTRAEQLSTLSHIHHDLFTSEKTARLLDAVNVSDYADDSFEARLVKLTHHQYERQRKLPPEFVARSAKLRSIAGHAWEEARAKSDYELFYPHLTAIIATVREQAELYGYNEHPYDALLDGYERGMTTKDVHRIFDELKAGIVPLVKRIAEHGDDKRDACLHGDYAEAKQEAFGKMVVTAFGYDWQHGRQDRSAHPFCINFGRDDVRITTRFNPQWISPALFGTMHEAGHAMYEQGMHPDLARTPLERGTSLGIHESQSRMWENVVGRSRPFWQHFYPELQRTFPERLNHVDLETFYRAINTVKPSLIRVEADEVTYNLHILLRFELELALLEGAIGADELPEAWNAKSQELFGITPTSYANGVLQDIHWSSMMFGYFPTYTLGNVLASQFYATALQQHPEIETEMAQGKFSTLLNWLRENIHQHGSKYTPNELIERVTGRPMETKPFLDYLQTKFGELY